MQGGVDGVSERVEDGCHIAIDSVIVVPDVGHRQGDVLGKGTGAVNAYALGILAQVTSAGPAVAAATAYDVAFSRDDIPGGEIGDIRPDFDDSSDKFVPDDHRHGDRFLGPGVPVVDVQVGAADPGLFDFDQAIADSELRKGDVLEFESQAAVVFDESFHGRIRYLVKTARQG